MDKAVEIINFSVELGNEDFLKYEGKKSIEAFVKVNNRIKYRS